MDPIQPLANPENRCDDCVQYRGDWCCTMNCSNANVRAFQPYGESEVVELRIADGRPRWHMATREGWQICGAADGLTLMMKASHYAVGTRFVLQEPITTADQSI